MRISDWSSDVCSSDLYGDLQGFPAGSVTGHAGELVAGHIGREPVIMLSGRAHYYEHGDANAMRFPIEVLKGLGVQSLILTNSAGSLRPDMPPGSGSTEGRRVGKGGGLPCRSRGG